MLSAIFFIIITPAYSQQSAIKVTILGTAGPEYFPDRSGISTLIEANGQKFLFDVGHGTNEQLYKSRINPKDINRIFLTHLHSDHYNGLADVGLHLGFFLVELMGLNYGDLMEPRRWFKECVKCLLMI